MALGRYEQRKNYEAAEANAIGTEYLRVDFLPATDAAAARLLLKNYIDQRILFYITRDLAKLHEVHDHTALLQQRRMVEPYPHGRVDTVDHAARHRQCARRRLAPVAAATATVAAETAPAAIIPA